MLDLPSTFLRAHHILNLMKNQWKRSQRLQNIQLKGLKRIVRHAYDHVPYYHRLFRSAKFKPENLKDLNDIRRIPITTKMDLQRNYPLTLAGGTKLNEQNVSFTSGSTGVPLKILFNKQASIYSNALVQYAFLECGVSLKDKIAIITAHAKSIERRKVYQNIAGLYLNEIYVPANIKTELLCKILKEIQPDIIYAYPRIIMDLYDSEFSEIDPRKIFSNAGIVTQKDREHVRNLYGIEINDTYGSHEFHRLAFECNQHSGLHMITDCALIEFLREGEPVSIGEEGEIVVTGFYNYTMPFIRYRLDDIGIPSNEICSCGRSWPLIKSIGGRIFERLSLPSGKELSPGAIYRVIQEEIHGPNIWCISQWQVVQEKMDKIILKIVKGKEFNLNVIERVKQKLESSIGEDIIITVNIVDDIPLDKAGKRRAIVPFKR